MDRRALIRLRIAFLLLGAALLLPLGWLLRSVDARLEAQRRLRHELVAERIFDEMERELTGLLQRENARPSAAYEDAETRVENWAPFVVGYFRRDAHSAQIVAKSQLARERLVRLEAALSIRNAGWHPTAASASESAPSEAQKHGLSAPLGAVPDPGSGAASARDKTTLDMRKASQRGAARELEPAFEGVNDGAGTEPVSPVPAASSDVRRLGADAVLKQLNRANEAREQVRQRAAAPAEPKAKNSSRKGAATEKADPLSGY